MAKPKALITGASTGIGKSYAQRLAKRGYDLVLVARDQARLEALAAELKADGAVSEVLVADLTQSAAVALVEHKLESDPDIAFFLNNAGIATVDPQLQTPVETIERLVALNVTAATRLALAAGRAFTQRKSGTIVNMASAVSINPERFNAVYSGSKAFVLALSQALTRELTENGVTIQSVLPGAVRTEIWERAGKDVNTLPQERVMDVDEMVDAALKGLELGERINHPLPARYSGSGGCGGGAAEAVAEPVLATCGGALQIGQADFAARMRDAPADDRAAPEISSRYVLSPRAMPSRISLRASSASPQRMILTHLPGSRSL